MKVFYFIKRFFLRANNLYLLAVFTVSLSFSQTNDSTLKKKKIKTFKLIDASTDFYTTFTKNNSINSQDELFKNHLYFYYNLTIQNRIRFKKFKLTNYFFNEFGVRNFKDSIIAISEDLYNFKNSVSFPFRKSKFSFNLSVSSKSQFWKHYTYKTDSNNKYIRNLYTSYLSPGYVIYSGGIIYNFWERSSIEIGLASGKTTKIKNQDIFTERKVTRLYGLENGVLKKTVLGIHVLVNISTKKLFKNFYLEQFSQVFMDKDSLQNIKSYNVDVNNAFHYLFLKYVRFSLRTKFLYDRTIFWEPTVVQQFSIGFYLNNKLY